MLKTTMEVAVTPLRGLVTLLLLSLLLATSVYAQLNTTINPLPPLPNPDSTSYPNMVNFLQKEDAGRQAELQPFATVINGGIHGTAAGMTSAAFALTGYTSSGNRVVQASAQINYQTMGCAANSTAWVMFNSGTTTPNLTFNRVSGTQYYVDCTSGLTQPPLPSDSGFLMQVNIVSSAISSVIDLRNVAKKGSPSLFFVDVSQQATSGNGTSGNPWAGWDNGTQVNFTVAGTVFFFPCGHYTRNTVTPLIMPNGNGSIIGQNANCVIWHIVPTNDNEVTITVGQDIAGSPGPGTFEYRVSGIQMQSTNTTKLKIAIKVIDGRTVDIADIKIGLGGYTWQGGAGTGSQCFNIVGREFIAITWSMCVADTGGILDGSPTDVNNFHNLDFFTMDHVQLLQTNTGTTNPAFVCGSSVWLTNPVFSNISLVGFNGTLLSCVTTSSALSGNNMYFAHIREEQEATNTSFFVTLDFSGAGSFGYMQGITFDDVLCCLHGKGFKIRNARGVTFKDTHMTSTTTVALDTSCTGTLTPPISVNTDCTFPITFVNSFVQTGMTLITTGLCITQQDVYGNYGGALPSQSRVVYDLPNVGCSAGAIGFHTWVPELHDNGGHNGTTYTVQQGIFETFGTFAYVQANLTLNVLDAGLSGTVFIAPQPAGSVGFPITPNCTNCVANNTIFPCEVGIIGGVTFPANYTQIIANMPPNSGNILFYFVGSAQGASSTLQNTQIASGTKLQVNCWFPTQ